MPATEELSLLAFEGELDILSKQQKHLSMLSGELESFDPFLALLH